MPFALSVFLFWNPLSALARLVMSDDRYTHIALVPIMSAILLYAKRREVFAQIAPRPKAGFALLAASGGVYAAASQLLAPGNRLSLQIALLILVWVSLFLTLYGNRALRLATFPFGFLALMVPFPEAVLNGIVTFLQRASADVSAVLFRLFGIPYFREGFRFLLPGVEIQVASECSGVRSAFGLFLSSILAGHLLLRHYSSRVIFSLAAIPIAIFKNGVRIVSLSYLGVYVNPAFLHGDLHHRYGGLVFSTLSLFLLMILLLVLQRWEVAAARPAAAVKPQS